jgi:hypothetical protein
MIKHRRAVRLLLAYSALDACMMLLAMPKSAFWFAEPWQVEVALLTLAAIVALSIWANIELRRETRRGRYLTGALGLYALISAIVKGPGFVALARQPNNPAIVWSLAVASSMWLALVVAGILCRPWDSALRGSIAKPAV